MKNLLSIVISAVILATPIHARELKQNEQNYGHRWLLDNGVSMHFVSELYPDLALRVAADFEDHVVPKQWLSELSLDSWKYTIQAFGENPDNKKDSEALVKEISDRLGKKEHMQRKNARYKENSYNLRNIHDKTLLLIIKSYMDMFDNPQTWKERDLLFPDGIYSDERIGVVRYDNLEFYIKMTDSHIEDRLYRPSNAIRPRDSIPCPAVVPFVHHVGIIHTHLSLRHKNADAVSGPSEADIKLLEEQNYYNPYQMSAVITLIDDKTYNVDVYFRDIETKDGKPVLKEGKPKNTAGIVVYDLGVFRI